jgi:DNA-binding MarR family transcriptional regulator
MSRARARTWDDMRTEMAGSTARAFGTLYRRFQDEANAGYAARDWKDVTLSHVQFLMEIGETGTRLSDIASALGTTKQYAGKLAKELKARQLISLVNDPTDGRAVLAKPTARGHRLFQDACEIRAELEERFLSGLTAASAAAFRRALAELLRTTE